MYDQVKTEATKEVRYLLSDYIQPEEIKSICWILEYYITGCSHDTLIGLFKCSQEQTIFNYLSTVMFWPKGLTTDIAFHKEDILDILKVIGLNIVEFYLNHSDPDDMAELPEYVQDYLTEEKVSWWRQFC